MKIIASIWREKMLGYLSLDIICSSKLTVTGQLYLFFFNRFRRRPNQVSKNAFSSSFNNPGYEPHPRDLHGDDSDAAPFTIPEYEDIFSGRQERDPLYAEIGPSIAAKVRKTRENQRDGEIHLPQTSGQAFQEMHRTNRRLPAQIHDDIAKQRGRKRQNLIAASNPTYESFPEELNGNRTKMKNNLRDKGINAKYPTGDQMEAASTCSSLEKSPDSDYSNLGKREFHKDALRREEPHYAKPPTKMFSLTSNLDSPVGASWNNNSYAPLSAVLPSKSNEVEFDGYAELDPSNLIPAGNRKDPRKIRTSQDQSHHVTTVHPDLGHDRNRPRRRSAFDNAEDNEGQSEKESKATKNSRRRSSKTKASGQLGPAEERIEYENRAYRRFLNKQEGWDGNTRVDNSRRENTAEKSSRTRSSKTRASDHDQFDFPEKGGTLSSENCLYDHPRSNNPEYSRNEEAPVLNLTTELGPDETII